MNDGQEKKIKKVGVLRGGSGKHYNSSLKKGGEIISHIFENLAHKYKVLDILVDKNHIWHLNGLPVNPSDLINKIDIVWNISHPSFSNILDSLSIPNIGVNSFSFALGNSREMLQQYLKKIDIPMPRHIVLPLYQENFDGESDKYAIKKAKEIFSKFSSPWIVKSFTPDSNMGIHLAKTFPELVGAIEDGIKHEKSILIEEFISGKVGGIHSVPGFRKQDIYTFPIGNSFGIFSKEEKEKLEVLAKNLHKHLGAKHYLKTDFVITPRGKIYLLSIDSHPDLKVNSHFSEACESVGAKMHNVVEHMLESIL